MIIPMSDDCNQNEYVMKNGYIINKLCPLRVLSTKTLGLRHEQIHSILYGIILLTHTTNSTLVYLTTPSKINVQWLCFLRLGNRNNRNSLLPLNSVCHALLSIKGGPTMYPNDITHRYVLTTHWLFWLTFELFVPRAYITNDEWRHMEYFKYAH